MADAGRSFWKGHLRLSLVTIPIRMVTATRADQKIAFHQIDRKSKQRIRYMKTVPGKGEVKAEDIAMGYEVDDGQYILLEDEEIDALKLKSRQTIELVQFVSASRIDPMYFDRPYLILPDGDVAEEGYRVIRDALAADGLAAIGQLTLRGKEHLVAVKPAGKGLCLETLHYAAEIKNIDTVFEDIGDEKLRPDLIEMARELITKKTSEFEPTRYKNHYAEALRALVDEKIKTGKVVSVDDDKDESASTVVDFMEALKRSVAQSGKQAAAPTPRAAEKKSESGSATKAAKSARRPSGAPAKTHGKEPGKGHGKATGSERKKAS